MIVAAGTLAGAGVGMARFSGAVAGAGAGVGVVELLAMAGAAVSVVCPAGVAAVSSLAGAPPQETSEAKAKIKIPARYAGAFFIV